MDLPGTLEVIVGIEDHRVVVSVRGEVDVTTCGQLRDCLDEARRFRAPQIAVDLTETTFLDSSGTDALIETYRHLGQKSGSLVLRGESERIRRLLEGSGKDMRAAIEPTDPPQRPPTTARD